MSAQKEMYDQIAALLGTIAKALDIPEDQVGKAVEDGRVALEMGVDEDGRRYVRAAAGGRAARLYEGAIRYEPGSEPSDEAGDGGCGCGRG